MEIDGQSLTFIASFFQRRFPFTDKISFLHSLVALRHYRKDATLTIKNGRKLDASSLVLSSHSTIELLNLLM